MHRPSRKAARRRALAALLLLAIARVRGEALPRGRRLVVLLLLGGVGGLLWPHLVDPVLFTRTSDGISSDETALARQFDADGWYVVLAAVGAAVAGATTAVADALAERGGGH